MDASHAGQVVSLSNQIATIQQALKLLDEGATITAMTLTPPAPPEPEPPPEPPPAPEPEEGEEPAPAPPPEDAAPPEPPHDEAAPSLTLSTEGLSYPPQMLDAIKQQELQLWRAAYDRLIQLGVTNVPAPPS